MNTRWIFVGGTGRSGTTVLARCLASADALHLIPTELRFHVDRGGLLDLANGEEDVGALRARLLGPWFERKTRMGVRGIRQYIEQERLAHAFDTAVDATDGRGPRATAREIWHRVTTAMFGPGRLVEMSPPTMMRADELERMLGDDLTLINVVRDGRDVAHSVARMRWGPDEPLAALYWWAHRMRAADKARRFCRREPLIVPFERLSDVGSRRHWARQLAEQVGGVTAEEMTAGLGGFKADDAHIGTWRRQVSTEHAERIDRTYVRILRELRDEGVVGLPPDPIAR